MASALALPSITLSPHMDLQSAVLGGSLIALSSTALMALLGKVSGMSGIVHSVIAAKSGAQRGWRVSYLAALLGAGTLLVILRPTSFGVGGRQLTPLAVALAGGLVGFGTRMAGGCTSGHGICGLPRLSFRSLTAVATFMATGSATAMLATRPDVQKLITAHGAAALSTPGALATLLPTAAALGLCVLLFRDRWFAAPAPGAKQDTLRVHAASAASAAVFGIGLGLSGMTDPAKVSGFLNPFGAGGWDPSLAGVMGAGVLINLVTFNYLSKLEARPILAGDLGTVEAGQTCALLADCLPMGSNAKNNAIDVKLVLGSALFGIGWGLVGICPGPGIVSLPAGDATTALLVPAMILGMAAFDKAFG